MSEARRAAEAMREAAANACKARAVRGEQARGGMGQIFAYTQDDEALACESTIRALPLPEATPDPRDDALAKAREALDWIADPSTGLSHIGFRNHAQITARDALVAIDALTKG
jgi:hypothetical protein